ncbi:hypothetical protein ACWNT8_15535 (plasmid) [Pigmentibacter ruber]
MICLKDLILPSLTVLISLLSLTVSHCTYVNNNTYNNQRLKFDCLSKLSTSIKKLDYHIKIYSNDNDKNEVIFDKILEESSEVYIYLKSIESLLNSNKLNFVKCQSSYGSIKTFLTNIINEPRNKKLKNDLSNYHDFKINCNKLIDDVIEQIDINFKIN